MAEATVAVTVVAMAAVTAAAMEEVRVEIPATPARQTRIDRLLTSQAVRNRVQSRSRALPKASVTKDQNTLGPLNAAHASATARANAAPNSAVGKIASYEQARDSALAISDPIEREQALDEAKDQLETAFNRTISEKEFSQIDSLLDE